MNESRLNADVVLSTLKEFVSEIKARNDVRRFSGKLIKIEGAVNRPLRVGFFGETQTDTSALINLLLQREILPSHRYGKTQPVIHIRYGSDASCVLITEKFRRLITRKAMFSALTENNDAEGLASPNVIYRAKPRGIAQRSRLGIMESEVAIIELHLDDVRLVNYEFLEVPLSLSSARETLPIRKALRSIDFAICATRATQAWKRTELEAWKRLGPTLRARSVLALVSKEPLGTDDQNKLSQRIRHETAELFKDFIYVSLTTQDPMTDPLIGLKRLLNSSLNEIKMARQKKAIQLLGEIKFKFPEIPVLGLHDEDQSLPKPITMGKPQAGGAY